MINLEISLEIILETYEKYVKSIINGITLCLTAIGQNTQLTIKIRDFFIIVKALGKSLNVEKDVTLEEMQKICIKNNIASEENVLECAADWSKEELVGKVQKCTEKMREISKNEGKEYDWEFRASLMEKWLEMDLLMAKVSLKIYETEVQRVVIDCNNE